MSTFWDKEVVIAQVVSTDKKSMTRVALVEKDGNTWVDVRKFVKGKGQPEGTYTQHTSSGLSLSVDKLMEVAGALAGGAELIEKGGFAHIEAKAKEATANTRKPRHRKTA